MKRRRTDIEMLQFDVNDYVQNPVMIKKLNQEKELAVAETSGLKIQVDMWRSTCNSLEVQKAELQVKLDDAQQKLADKTYKSFIQLVIQLIGTIMIGLGVNIVTSTLSETNMGASIVYKTNIVPSTAYSWVGWVLIIFGVILEVIAFFIAFSPSHGR